MTNLNIQAVNDMIRARAAKQDTIGRTIALLDFEWQPSTRSRIEEFVKKLQIEVIEIDNMLTEEFDSVGIAEIENILKSER